jgi:hypothetical protein
MGLGDVFTSQGRVPPSAGARRLGEAQYPQNRQMAAGFRPENVPGVPEAFLQPDDLLGSGLLKAAMIPLKKAPFIGYAEQAAQPLLKLFRGEYDHLGKGLRKKVLASQTGTTFFSPHKGTAQSYGQGYQGFNIGKLDKSHQLYDVNADVSKVFDYEDPKHLKRLIEAAGKRGEGSKSYVEFALDKIKKGNWNAIENPNMREIIKDAGFNGLSVFEDGVKNIGFFTDKNPIIPNALGSL